MSNHQSAHAALEVEEREVSQSGQTEVGSQGFMVRRLSHLCAELGIDKEFTDVNRPISLSHLLRVYSEGSSVRPSTPQASPTLSLQKTGDHSISTSRSVSHPLILFEYMSCLLTSKFITA